MVKIENNTILESATILVNYNERIWVELVNVSWKPKFCIQFIPQNDSNKNYFAESDAKNDYGEITVAYNKNGIATIDPMVVATADFKPISFAIAVQDFGHKLSASFQFSIENKEAK